MLEEKKYVGIVEDPRSIADKEKDWKKVELVSAGAPVKWIAKAQPTVDTYDLNEKTWRRFPVRDQDGSSTCVMQTSAKILGINNYLEESEFVVLSASFGYSYRINKSWGDGTGMTKPDVGNILNNKGLTLEVLAPSQKMSEVDVNKYVPKESHKQIALVYKTKNDIDLDINGTFNIESIASAIASNPKGKAVMLWFKSTYAEWNQDCPTLSGATVFEVSHSVTGVDFILWKGEKAIVIEDSWGEFFGLSGQRIITESFLKARCFLAKEFVDVANNWRDQVVETIEKPKPHVFMRDLEFSPVYNSDEEVKALQGILRYETFFPTHVDGQAIDITGYYGAITAKAVLAFQEKYRIASPATLQALGGKRVGPATRAKLNELYGG